MDEAASSGDTKQIVLQSLAFLYPWIRPYYSLPISDYACRLFEIPHTRIKLEIRRCALTKLLDAVKKAGRRSGLPEDVVGQICGELERRRVLQTGPHLLLLFEAEAYYTHAFSLLGLKAHGCSSYLSYAVSTVSLVEKPRKGPGWLTVNGTPVNLFGLSRSRMIGYNLLSGPGSYRFALLPAEPNICPQALTLLEGLLPKQGFERPAHALKAANIALWPKIFGDGFAFLQIDDEDVTDLVVSHLRDENSWLRTRLFEAPKLASDIVAGFDKLAAGPWGSWVARGTDFFWFYEDGKRHRLRLESGELVHATTGKKLVRFTAAEIVERLVNRSLVPNLFLMFLVISILPGVRALGGSHQPIYYPLMRYALCKALEAADMDADLRHALVVDDMPAAWGHRVIECDQNPFDLYRAGRMGEASDHTGRFATVPFMDACGSMSSFAGDSSWLELYRRIQLETIAPTNAEWGFS
jgi:hypothetical protein